MLGIQVAMLCPAAFSTLITMLYDRDRRLTVQQRQFLVDPTENPKQQP